MVSVENIELRSELLKSKSTLDLLQHENLALKDTIANRNKEISKKAETIKWKSVDLEEKVRELEAKDATIVEMHKEITKAKEFVLNKQQVSNELEYSIPSPTP